MSPRIFLALLGAVLILLMVPTAVAQSPLTISGVQAIAITDTSATIIWTTDEPADSTVNYGFSCADLEFYEYDSALVTEHSITLTDLTPGTTYYYEVCSGGVCDDNNGACYYFITLERLEGLGWCPDYPGIGDATLIGSMDAEPRPDDPNVIDLHFEATFTFTVDTTTDTFDLELFGTRVRSIFSLGQRTESVSASFRGLWLAWDHQHYIVCVGGITTHPGETLTTVKPYLLLMRTTGEVKPPESPDSYVESLEYIINRFAQGVNGLINALSADSVKDVIGGVLSRIVAIFVEVRNLLEPYIP